MKCNDVLDAAVDWLVVMRLSEEADSRRIEFEEWLHRHPDHLRAYEDVSRFQERMAHAPGLLRDRPSLTPEAFLSEIAGVAHRNRRDRDLKAKMKWWVGWVALIAILVLVARGTGGAALVAPLIKFSGQLTCLPTRLFAHLSDNASLSGVLGCLPV